MIPRIRIAPHGPEFSRVVYGTWRLLDGPGPAPTPQEVNRRLHRCVELGMTTIDTAEIYGGYEVEEALGAGLALSPALRGQLQIVTKAGIYVPNARHPERRTAHYNATGPRLIKSLEKSLRLLRTDRVELLLVHRPDWLTSADDTAAGLNQLIQEGKIASAGVSNYTAAQFSLLNSRVTQPLVTNQLEFHLLHMDPIIDGTLDQCEQLRVAPMAWSPLAGGRLFDASNDASHRIQRAALAMSDRYNGASVELLAYAWILAHPARPLPIVGTNRVERIELAARASTCNLEREDWYALWEAAQGRRVP
ncbi:MAG: aldo/keto reductase [Gemmatimonadaceae bacterium]